jgi:hypothetical protein
MWCTAWVAVYGSFLAGRHGPVDDVDELAQAEAEFLLDAALGLDVAERGDGPDGGRPQRGAVL